jgi:hypothetical protein
MTRRKRLRRGPICSGGSIDRSWQEAYIRARCELDVGPRRKREPGGATERAKQSSSTGARAFLRHFRHFISHRVNRPGKALAPLSFPLRFAGAGPNWSPARGIQGETAATRWSGSCWFSSMCTLSAPVLPQSGANHQPKVSATHQCCYVDPELTHG